MGGGRAGGAVPVWGGVGVARVELGVRERWRRRRDDDQGTRKSVGEDVRDTIGEDEELYQVRLINKGHESYSKRSSRQRIISTSTLPHPSPIPSTH